MNVVGEFENEPESSQACVVVTLESLAALGSPKVIILNSQSRKDNMLWVFGLEKIGKIVYPRGLIEILSHSLKISVVG